jgi:L-ascorbate metabolism protein UlaG (beta-lactamase superfamily)
MTASLFFVGTATTLLRLGPFAVLTDPNLLHRGQRAYLGRGLVSRRRSEPVLPPGGLPALDAIVLSHLHGDHWDREAARRLDRSVPILTTPHAARRLRLRGRRSVGLGTWEQRSAESGEHRLTVTALPGRHAPRPVSRLLPPVMGTMLELARRDGTGESERIYLSGDTLLVPELAAIRDRFPEIDTAVLHLGGTTLPGGLMVTMDDQQGADLVELLDPRQVVPVHYDDYPIFRSPLQAFLDTASSRGIRDRVTPVRRGETVPTGQITAALG